MFTDQSPSNTLYPYKASRLNDYLFVFQPDEPTSRMLHAERVLIQENCGGPIAQPVIQLPVIRFLGTEQMEERIIRWVQRICAGEQSFIVGGAIANDPVSQSVLVQVDETEGFKQFVSRLQVLNEFIIAEHCPAMLAVRKPSLVLAEQLPSAAIQQARSFPGKYLPRLVMNELVLYRRQHAFDPWKTVNIFRLPALQESSTN